MRAKPILSLTLLAAALAVPGTAASLGLGKLSVQSSLGQPLSAQIELTSIAKEELDTVTARVADPSLYRQNNLAYQGVLSRARVALERLPSGDAILKVTTPGSVAEPYLDLLVEVNWASGRVVRAYTFLLDPPGAVVPVTPVEPVTPRVGAGAPRAAAQASAQAPAPRAPAEGKGGAANTYAVKRGDTLSRIASEYKPPAATLEQMLVALFTTNKDAFHGENMNRLRAGAILTIPSADEAAAVPAAEATKTIRVQAADWRAYQDRVAGAAPAAEGAGGRVASGKIGTVVEEKVPAAPPGRDQLKVTREAAPAVAAPVAEEMIARDKALKEAQARIGELEKTLKDLQKAIELRGQTGAQLQAQADAAKGKAPEPAKAEPPKVAAPVSPPAPEAKPAETPKMAEPVKPPEPAKAALPAKPAEPPKVAEPAKAPAAKAAAPKAAAPKAESSLMDDLVGGTPAWVIGGGALAALLGVGALIAARRRKTVKFEDSIIGGSDIKTNTVFGSTGGGVVNTGENSLATDFSREGLGNIDTDEVDPIAEAEVYLAYGRDAQAEEILKDALKKDPQRQEIHLKLLEIHAQHNKPSAFETVAAELYSISHGQGEIWQKAVTLGRQLDPGNPMFGESPAAAAAAIAGAAAGAQAPAAPRTEAPRSPSAGASPEIAKELEDESALDFRFDEEVSHTRTPKTTSEQIALIDAAEREFEESAKRAAAAQKTVPERLGEATAAGVVAAAGAAGLGGMKAEKATSSGDLEFRLDESEKPAPLRKAEAASAHAAVDTGSLARPHAGMDLEKLDLSFDPSHTTFEDATPSVLDGQWHDAATKLDLAKAYQEMGDVEGAREILQEVLHEGDEEQKAEAHALLAKLG